MVLRSALVPLAACLCLALCWPVQAAPRTYVVDIHLLPPPGVRNYYLDLLSLILNASKAPDEVIEFRFAERDLRQQRWGAPGGNAAHYPVAQPIVAAWPGAVAGSG